MSGKRGLYDMVHFFIWCFVFSFFFFLVICQKLFGFMEELRTHWEWRGVNFDFLDFSFYQVSFSFMYIVFEDFQGLVISFFLSLDESLFHFLPFVVAMEAITRKIKKL